MGLRQRKKIQEVLRKKRLNARPRKNHLSIALDILYGIGLTAASPVIGIKMLTNPRWRRGFVERLGAIPERKDGSPCLWIHCASVGETLAARSIVGGLAQEMPDWQVAVSTTTPEGNKQAREHFNGSVS